MSSIVIRKAHFSDIPYLYDICLKTGKNGKTAEDSFFNPYMLGEYYAVNYMLYEESSCFVIEDTKSNIVTPLGYIVGCCDSKHFSNWMEKTWLPILRKRYTVSYDTKTDIEKNLVNLIHKVHAFEEKDWTKLYPAHLHIDLLPQLQGMGCGKILLNTFCDYLKNENVCGVHLGVSAKNKNAIGFYERMGFTILESFDWGLLLGKILS